MRAPNTFAVIMYWLFLVCLVVGTIQLTRYGWDIAQQPVGTETSIQALIWLAALNDAFLLALATVAFAMRSRAAIWLIAWFILSRGSSALAPLGVATMPLVVLPLLLLLAIASLLVRYRIL
ncbi:MAG: hypothetical protein AAGL96_03845 [Pseudomonadota bacterium]